MMPMNKRRYSKDFREQALSKVYSRPDEQNIDDKEMSRAADRHDTRNAPVRGRYRNR